MDNRAEYDRERKAERRKHYKTFSLDLPLPLYDALVEKAEQRGMKTGVFLRSLAEAELAKEGEGLPPKVQEELSPSLVLLSRIASNLHQIVFHSKGMQEICEKHHYFERLAHFEAQIEGWVKKRVQLELLIKELKLLQGSIKQISDQVNAYAHHANMISEVVDGRAVFEEIDKLEKLIKGLK